MAIVAVLMALAYALTNGLHDAANSIAALVATGAARPLQAIVLATVGNVLGPLLLGAAVADTIAGIVTVNSADIIAVVGAASPAQSPGTSSRGHGGCPRVRDTR